MKKKSRPSKPNWKLEKALQQEGFLVIGGADEVGRGAWAGPLVASVVIFASGSKIKGLNDSKLLKPADRRLLFDEIVSEALDVGVGQVGAEEIDKLGLSVANMLAVQRALDSMSLTPEFLLMDGLVTGFPNLLSRAVVKGDRLSCSIAAASIVAKVVRDGLMEEYHSDFPDYDFHLHKGYGTKKHQDALAKYGPCILHRKSFSGVTKRNELTIFG